MTQEEVVELMKTSKNEDEWNTNCDKVKAAHDGNYPDYWYLTIVLSGVATETSAKW